MFRHMLLAVLLALGLAACDPKGELVCKSGPGAIRFTSLSSTSDLTLARQLAPDMVKEVASAAADSCGLLEAGVAGPNPVSDLVLEPIQLTPKAEKAPNRKPFIKHLTNDAHTFLQRNLVDPLARIEATHTSPLFGLIIAMAMQAEAHHEPAGCGVILGDAIAVEEIGGHKIDFRRREATRDERVGLKAVVDKLKPLAGGTIVLTGAGGHSNLSPDRLLRARGAIDATLKAAHIRTVWTRTPELPPECKS